MTEQRYSVMVLPYIENKLLLQSFSDDGQTIWDGFGSFYQKGEDSKVTAQKVFVENFNSDIKLHNLTERAQLTYFITKPTGTVELKVTVYLAEVKSINIDNKKMKWFESTAIPLSHMHPATVKWLPGLLQDASYLNGIIRVDQPGNHTKGTVTEFTIQ